MRLFVSTLLATILMAGSALAAPCYQHVRDFSPSESVYLTLGGVNMHVTGLHVELNQVGMADGVHSVRVSVTQPGEDATLYTGDGSFSMPLDIELISGTHGIAVNGLFDHGGEGNIVELSLVGYCQ